jgi:hypothetical protein
MDSNLLPLVDELERQVRAKAEDVLADPKMAELRKLHSALNALQDSCGVPKTPFIDILGLQDSIAIRPAEFYKLDPLDAAKRYLKRRGVDGAEFDEIIAALRSGGLELSSHEEVVVRRGLSRSTLDVAKIGENRYVLLEFLPHVKRGGGKRRARNMAEGQKIEAELAAEREPEDETVIGSTSEE